MRAPLLVEIQTEELPPKSLKTFGQVFANAIVEGLGKAHFVTGSPRVQSFATPRRLAVLVHDVAAVAADREVVEKLMPAAVAFDADGRPTDALRKRLDKAGHADGADRVYLDGEGKTAAAFLKTVVVGRALGSVLEAIVVDALDALPIPKRMTYQQYDDAGVETTVSFVRPAHHVVALHDATVLPIRVLGIDAGRITAGHRFMGRRNLSIAHAVDYEATLRAEGKVVASFASRRTAIVEALSKDAGHDRVVMPDALLDEVTSLVEWPVVYEGRFDAAFLDVPQECLILTMQQNQKYFAMTDATGAMVNRFLVVSNLETPDPSAIVGGNERVLRARLADAKFFFDQDRKRTLASRVESLKSVVYHNKLGTQYERMRRVETVAGRIADLLGADANAARRAAHLAKADLVTDMVGEFPELQGLMGRYYATHDGETPDVARAIEEQYRPRFAGDALPETTTGICLALADKLETIAGLFGIGAIPTGDKDPFALRRHALGVIRILVEKRLRVDHAVLVGLAVDTFAPAPETRTGTIAGILDFIRGRLAGYCRDLGYTTNEVDAVLHSFDTLADVPALLEAVRAFAGLPESASLASADKRVRNILAKSDRGDALVLDRELLKEDAEIALKEALDEVGPRADSAYESGDFKSALIALATLKAPVDRFFDEVMVNAEDPAIRANRFVLLNELHRPMNRVADLSKLAA